MTDDEAEREYFEARAAYDKALVRLSAAKKARPKPAIRAGSLEHMAQVRDAIWQAYLAGERDYEAMAKRFGRTRGNISTVIRDVKKERGFGPITAEEHRYRVMFDEAMAQYKALAT
jgi:hypothetical protein